MAIVLYFVLAAVVFALGCWQGYIIAYSKFKNQKVQVKYIHTDCVPICVSKKLSQHELLRMDSEYASKYLEMVMDGLKHQLGEQVCKYAKFERIDCPSLESPDSVVFKGKVLVRPYKDGDQS